MGVRQVWTKGPLGVPRYSLRKLFRRKGNCVVVAFVPDEGTPAKQGSWPEERVIHPESVKGGIQQKLRRSLIKEWRIEVDPYGGRGGGKGKVFCHLI